MDEYVVQVRLYSGDTLTFRDTKQFNFQVDNLLGIVRNWVEGPNNYRGYLGFKEITWCNIMIRKNGKLISYKDL